MKLKNIIEGMDVLDVIGDTGVEIRSITADSRKATPGAAFVALRGGRSDGRDFIGDAVTRGAVAVVSERGGPRASGMGEVVSVLVRDSRDAVAHMASLFNGNPSDRLNVIGVTGTNGKTTTSYVIKRILEEAGRKTGLIGTIKYVVGQRESAAGFTTPEALEFQRLLRDMLTEGCEFVVSEVSSHALAMKRVDHTRFRCAVFTNFTRDHLDFHGTMEDYFAAKRRLFAELLEGSGHAVINADDPRAGELRAAAKGAVLTYGLREPADIAAGDVVAGFSGLRFTLHVQGARYPLSARLLGIPNVYNLLAGIAATISFGITPEVIARAVAEMPPVEGRFESIESPEGVLFIIDYAHTPDALRNLLGTAGALSHGRVITVFGCGGDRDQGKRPLMGEIASEMSDFAVITSDNPRFERPEAIIEDIVRGVQGRDFTVVPDRREAIRDAVRRAKKGDIVVIAGKGHETYQEVRGVRYHLDDRELVREAIAGGGTT